MVKFIKNKTIEDKTIEDKTIDKIIEVENLSYKYGNYHALHKVNLNIEKGKKVAFLGPNGAGKSTLLLHLNGIFLPQQGNVRVLGQNLGPGTEAAFRTKVGLVFQDPDDQVFSPTVEEDVAFGPLNLGLTLEEVKARVDKSLRVVGMHEFSRRAPYQLSYGQKKRVAIAGILAMEPEIIILDEPVAYLDPRAQDELFALLNEINSQGTTIIIATHDVDLAAEWADQIVFLADGQILAEGGKEILVDTELLSRAHLRLPLVTRIMQQVADLFPEFSAENIPSTVEEAVTAIRNLTIKKS